MVYVHIYMYICSCYIHKLLLGRTETTPYHQELLHSFPLVCLSIESEDGSSQSVDSYGQAVGIVLVALKEGEVGCVSSEGQLFGQSHAHKHQIQAPASVVLTRLV